MIDPNSSIISTADQRIRSYSPVLPPAQLLSEVPLTAQLAADIHDYRQQVTDILHGKDQRLMVVVGPCSIHDPEAAIDYAKRLKVLSEDLQQQLLVVMRVYFEKPRTTVGWKGLINDPDLDRNFDINKGLKMARQLMLDITQIGLPIGAEFLDLLSPQYIADLVSWGAIGARTTESQGHRELASGVSCPVGFKNGTAGSTNIACDAVLASERSHIFMGIDKHGQCSIVHTKGNSDCHLILRGGKKPNYDAISVNDACKQLESKGLPERVMIDFSHANSLKQHKRQLIVAEDIAMQIHNGDKRIIGVMAESFLEEGNQSLDNLADLKYGVSVTDACMSWQDTENMLRTMLAPAVKTRMTIA